MLAAELNQQSALERAYETLSWIESLQDNWDEEDAPGFPAPLVAMARDIVEELPRVPFIAPTGCESIQMEYEENGLGYLEFELFPDGVIREFYLGPQHKSFTRDIDPRQMKEEIECFYGSGL